jgi:hypothetical protein
MLSVWKGCYQDSDVNQMLSGMERIYPFLYSLGSKRNVLISAAVWMAVTRVGATDVGTCSSAFHVDQWAWNVTVRISETHSDLKDGACSMHGTHATNYVQGNK